MNEIRLDTIYYDVLERLDTALERDGITPDQERKMKSRTRIFSAINEAVKAFVSSSAIPANALSGYIPEKLYHLHKLDITDYTGIAVFGWPDAANLHRQDGGLLRLMLDGNVYQPEFTNDTSLLSKRLMSLQQKVSKPLLYGPSHQDAVVDLNSNKIYVPENVTPKAEIVINPDTIATESLARGKAKITVTGGATAAGDITITNVTAGENITVSVLNEDTVYEVASKIVKAVQSSTSIQLTAVLFADEIWFYTDDVGSTAFTTVTISAAATGVTFSETDLELLPKETVVIPIDESHREVLSAAAVEHLKGVSGGAATSTIEQGISNAEVEEG